jgi:hypothetical protein
MMFVPITIGHVWNCEFKSPLDDKFGHLSASEQVLVLGFSAVPMIFIGFFLKLLRCMYTCMF